METLKVFSLIFLLAGAWLFMSNDDYHKKFDKSTTIRYNCDMLIGGWHPDVPTEVIEKCKSGEREHVYIKTNQE
jgi:hypothetical protein